MSLDVTIYIDVDAGIEPYRCILWEGNITHNLINMANAADCYKPIWCPEELGITTAKQMIEPLEKALKTLREDPDKFRRHAPSNGWGTYSGLVEFINDYLENCKRFYKANIEVDK